MRSLLGIALLALSLPAAVRDAAASPRVAVTVKPLHSLVAAVMAGVGEPDLIIRGAGSPHTYNLRPSEARALQAAGVIFWVGESLETFMARPLAALGDRARIVTVQQAPGVRLLPGRAGGPWVDHHEPEGGVHGRGAGDSGAAAARGAAGWDGHLWLDPENAAAVVRVAAQVLSEVDPSNRERYGVNAARLLARIAAVDNELAAQLAPVRGAPYVVFHDAYQYFERRYALNAIGSVAVGPERQPGARRITEVRERIRSLGARCVFAEPQFPSAVLGTLLDGTGARAGTLDPLGADLSPGPEAWFALMRALGSSLSGCLR